MEFENYERELKYLINNGKECTSEQILNFLYQNLKSK